MEPTLYDLLKYLAQEEGNCRIGMSMLSLDMYSKPDCALVFDWQGEKYTFSNPAQAILKFAELNNIK
jgi:hypothetical protein